MTRFLKLVLVLVAAALTAFAAYDILAFQLRRDEIDRLIRAAHPLERSPPPMLAALVRADFPDLPSSSARELLFALDTRRRGSLEWQSEWLAWTVMVRIHLSREKQLAILCSRTFLGNRAYGFQAGALSEYGRGLDVLSERELARLVVFTRSPTRWRKPERAADLDVAVDSLIRRSRTISRS